MLYVRWCNVFNLWKVWKHAVWHIWRIARTVGSISRECMHQIAYNTEYNTEGCCVARLLLLIRSLYKSIHTTIMHNAVHLYLLGSKAHTQYSPLVPPNTHLMLLHTIQGTFSCWGYPFIYYSATTCGPPLWAQFPIATEVSIYIYINEESWALSYKDTL